MTELEKLNSYADEGTNETQGEEQATQPSAEVAAEEQPASPTSGKASPKKRGSLRKSTAAAGEKHEREDGQEHATGEETAEGEKKPKRSRTTRAPKAEAKAAGGAAAEGEAAAGAKKKGPGRPRKSSKKEKDDAIAPAEGDAPAMEVDVGGAPGDKAIVAEGETVSVPEPAKKKRGPGRPKKGDSAGTAASATLEHGEGTKEDVPAARTRAKEPGSEKMPPEQPAVVEQVAHGN